MFSILLVAMFAVNSVALAQQQHQSVVAETDCLMRQYAIQASNSLLPACRLWDLSKCQLQINAVYDSLFKPNCMLLYKPTAETRFEKDSPSVAVANNNSTLYVSPAGNDSQEGTVTKPLLTLKRALQLIADWKKPHELKTIKLFAGEYTISNTVEITHVHSNLTIIGSNNDTTSTLAGLVNLKNLKWEKYDAKIIKTVLTEEQTAQLDTYSQLFINGKPQIRARFPNVAKFTGFQYSAIKPKKWGKGKAVKTSRVINRDMTPIGVQYMPKSTAFNKFSLGFAVETNTFEPPVSYFFDPKHQAQGACPHTLPTSVTFSDVVFPTVWKRPEIARFHALHWYGWGMWTFQLKSQTKTNAEFARGGWQEARGDCGKGGKLWFVDNALELLDAPNEYFLDMEAKTLYLYALEEEEDNPMVAKSVLIELGSNITTLLSIANATQISIANLEFKGGYEVTMKPFEVPSGGDWSLHRSSALYVDASNQVLIEDSKFTYNAGNALFINGNSSQVRIVRNEFYGIGSSCVLVAGLPGYLTPDPWVIKSFPKDIVIANNVMSHFGLSIKQSSGVFISLSKQVTVSGNTIYNGPRAGITINDQFAGGHLIQQNLVFEQTLETSDNGPFIVWHRQMFEEPMEKDFDYVENNFFLGSYGVGVDGGGKGINVDDGAFKVKSRNNVVVWGFHKIKGAEVEVSHNLFVNPITTSCVYFSYYTRTPARLSYHDNTCVSSFAPYAFGIATASLPGVCDVKNFQANTNKFYYDGTSQTMEQCAKNWNYWTKTWLQDTESVYSKQRPSASAVGEMVKEKLEWV